MPQAVASYLESNNLRIVDEIKRDILSLYRDDFRRIDATGRISMLFDAIPAQLNTNVSRYQVSSVLTSERADSILEIDGTMYHAAGFKKVFNHIINILNQTADNPRLANLSGTLDYQRFSFGVAFSLIPGTKSALI